MVTTVNYHPVALISHLRKIFEQILRTKLVEILEHQGFLKFTQYGSRAGHFTLSQLLLQYDRVFQLLL